MLHWVLALGILGAFAMGVYVEDLPFSPAKLKLVNWHKWAGVTILLLSVARLAWRLKSPPPALPEAHHGAHAGWRVPTMAPTT